MLVSDSCRPRSGPEIGSEPWLVKFRKKRENGNTEPGRRRGRPCCLSAAKQKSLGKSAISSPAMPRHTQLGADQSEASISRGEGEGWTNERAQGRCGHLLSRVSPRPGLGCWLLAPDSLLCKVLLRICQVGVVKGSCQSNWKSLLLICSAPTFCLLA